MLKLVAACLIFLALMLGVTYGATGESILPTVKIDLGELKKADPQDSFRSLQVGTVDAGQGLILKLSGKEQESVRMEVWDGTRKVTDIPAIGWFTNCFRQEFQGASYWIMEDFSGGQAGHGQYSFVCRPAKGQEARFLGTHELGLVGGEDPVKFFVDGEQLYWLVLDARFNVFPISCGASYMAGNLLFDCFYQLSPQGFKIHNLPFKNHYLSQIKKFEDKIRSQAGQRQRKAPFIIAKHNSSLVFTDDLGVFLTGRTINYLCAREEAAAWRTLEEDTRKYYQSTNGLDFLKKEIAKTLQKKPF